MFERKMKKSYPAFVSTVKLFKSVAMIMIIVFLFILNGLKHQRRRGSVAAVFRVG